MLASNLRTESPPRQGRKCRCYDLWLGDGTLTPVGSAIRFQTTSAMAHEL